MFRAMISMLVLAAAQGVATAQSPASDEENKRPPNVLFIAVDDLRPQLGCYGHEFMITPHMDRLAAEGRLFLHHYVQVPTCGASRLAMLTGRYPRQGSDLSNDAIRRRMSEKVEQLQPESFAHLFRRSGYQTVCLGKISHYPDGRIYAYDGSGDGALEMPHSWDDVGLSYGKWERGWDAFFGYADGSGRIRGESPPIESADVGDDGYPDGLTAQAAIDKLNDLQDQPFLLCVGFFKPHLPFCAPQKYFDLYDADALPLSPHPDQPADVVPRSMHTSNEVFGNYGHGVKHPRTDSAHHRKLRQAYFASVSYSDAQVGRVLDELDRLGLSENTIVALWGDHGWHLGDLSLWGKHSLFERSLLSTLIVRTPGMASPGKATSGMVETVDLYPTLAELCSLDAPGNLDGTSLVPLLNDPQSPGKPVTYGFRRPHRRTLRTEQYRLVELPPEDGHPAAFELYNHQDDPGETRNVAAAHPDIVAQLMPHFEQLDARLAGD